MHLMVNIDFKKMNKIVVGLYFLIKCGEAGVQACFWNYIKYKFEIELKSIYIEPKYNTMKYEQFMAMIIV